MNPIKEFFKRKAAERKFKAAGPAQKLDNAATSSKKDSSGQIKGKTAQQHRVSREAERAAAAALERIEQQKPTNLNWSTQAIRNQAKKELELENSLKEKSVSQPRQIIKVEQDCPNFTVSGVFYTCPIIGPEILPRDAVENKIRTFLYEQLEQEMGLTACLMIHTLNKNKSKVQKGVETLSRYLTNIIDEPTEEKYRKIRLKNKAFQERIADLEGAFDFLIAAGFIQQNLKLDENEEEYFVFQDENLDIEKLQMLKEALLSAEPILPVLDRNLKVLKPAELVEKVNLPQDFFHLTLDEVKREQETRSETVEMMSQLRTKAMREKDEVRERHIYKFTLIRIRFPDGIILQGTFSVYEKLSAVREFVAENLADPSIEFDLLLSGGIKVSDDNQSLHDHKLIPAVVLNFQASDETSLSGSAFLNSECMALLSDL
jgi:UBX domain-containing protein 6